jgi:hypothetical protein
VKRIGTHYFQVWQNGHPIITGMTRSEAEGKVWNERQGSIIMEARPAEAVERILEAANRVVLQHCSMQPVGHDAMRELQTAVNALRKESGLTVIAHRYRRAARDPGPEKQAQESDTNSQPETAA